MVQSPGPDTRKRAERRGRRAETLAAFYLRLKGYRILERRYRSPAGEIDLIVMRGHHLAFVEVKARPDLMRGMEAITVRQRRRMIKTAQMYVTDKPDLAQAFMRFDAVVMRPFALPVHIVNAWNADDPGGW